MYSRCAASPSLRRNPAAAIRSTAACRAHNGPLLRARREGAAGPARADSRRAGRSASRSRAASRSAKLDRPRHNSRSFPADVQISIPANALELGAVPIRRDPRSGRYRLPSPSPRACAPCLRNRAPDRASLRSPVDRKSARTPARRALPRDSIRSKCAPPRLSSSHSGSIGAARRTRGNPRSRRSSISSAIRNSERQSGNRADPPEESSNSPSRRCRATRSGNAVSTACRSSASSLRSPPFAIRRS